MSATMPLLGFKLRLADRHVRVVPSTGPDGRPFGGPGVDLRGSSAEEALRIAAPLVAAIEAFEPGARVRSIAIDLVRPRLTATLDPTAIEADRRARVVRIDEGPALRMLLAHAEQLRGHLAIAAAEALRARASTETA